MSIQMTRPAVLTSKNNSEVFEANFLDTEDEEVKATRPKKLKLRNTTRVSTAQTDAKKDKSLLKKDVFWQTSEPVNFQENMDYFLSSLMVNEQFSFSDDFLNELDIVPTTQQDFTTQQPSSSFTPKFPNAETANNHQQVAFDSFSSTSDDSVGSMESIEESYKMLTPPSFQTPLHKESHTSKPPPYNSYNYSTTTIQKQQQQHRQQIMNNKAEVINNTQNITNGRGGTTKHQTKYQSSTTTNKRKIDPVYNNDPYLQRHRLLVNARQKNRMMKINNMYTMLNDLIPEGVVCDAALKPHSKLGILKRAIVYWTSLSNTLNTTTVVESNQTMVVDNSQTILSTGDIKEEEIPEDFSNYCLMTTLNNLSN